MYEDTKRRIRFFITTIIECSQKKLNGEDTIISDLLNLEDGFIQVTVKSNSKKICELTNESVSSLGYKKEMTSNEFFYARNILKELKIWEDIPDSDGNRQGKRELFFKLKLKSLHLDTVFEWLNDQIEDVSATDRASIYSIGELNERRDISAIVQWVRSRCHHHIQTEIRPVRLWGVTTTVNVDSIYVPLQVIKHITLQSHDLVSELSQQVQSGSMHLNRLGIKPLEVERREAIEEMVGNTRCFVILGEVGAGKTMLLKNIVVQCILGNLLSTYIPIYISLLKVSNDIKAGKKFSLLEQIGDWTGLGSKNPDLLKRLLRQGKFLILLDALDEVSIDCEDEIQRHIQIFKQEYPANRYIITCRKAAVKNKYLFASEQFHEIVIPPLNEEQIKSYITNYFKVNFQPQDAVEKANLLIELLQSSEHQAIAELTTSPLLVNLCCFVFQNSNRLPATRHELLSQSIQLLLDRWDIFRRIKRDEIFPLFANSEISKIDVLVHKLRILHQIALDAFTHDNIIFEKRTIEPILNKYLRDTFNITEPVQLRSYSEAIITGIAIHHSLLVEQAKDCYSFSHLAIHEYLCADTIQLNSNWEQLAAYIGKPRWQEVFILCFEKVNSADALLLVLLQKMREMFSHDTELKLVLEWCSQRAIASSSEYKSVAVRAFYYSYLQRYNIDSVVESTIRRRWESNFEDAYILSQTMGLDDKLTCDLKEASKLREGLKSICQEVTDKDEVLSSLVQGLNSNLIGSWLHVLLPQLLQLKIQSAQFRSIVESSKNTYFNFLPCNEWWHNEGHAWATEFLICHGKDFLNQRHSSPQFSKAQRELLQSYYDASFTIATGLKHAYCVSDSVRNEVEQFLFAPID